MSYRYDPGCKCPRFQELLDKLVPDKSIQDVLQEFFGYCLTRDTDMKAMLIMYGDTCTGKSTLSNVLEAMVGPANRSAVPLEGFWDRFAAQQTIGKLVNFCGDAKKIDTLAEGVIKRFTGGDTLLVDRKYKDPVSAKMTAKIVVATNVFPVVRDITDALWSRFIVVPMDVRLEEHEVDRTFLNSEKQNWPLRRELPGIFNWAIKGLKRLKQQGHFTVSQRLLQARAEVRHDNCSVALFVGERCKEGGTTTTKEFMHEYQCYCENQNLKRLSGVEVRKVIRMLMPDIRHRRLGARGQQQWYFDGVTVVVPRD
jgi:P4 family phage/plasmid primase-like protien